MTTACEPLRKGLSAFVDGETTPEETRAAHAHLAHCVACRRAVEDWRLIDRLLPPEMNARPLTEQTVRGILARRRARRLAKTLLIAATLGSLIGGTMLVTLVSHSEDRGQLTPSGPAVFSSSPSGEAGAPTEMRARPASPRQTSMGSSAGASSESAGSFLRSSTESRSAVRLSPAISTS